MATKKKADELVRSMISKSLQRIHREKALLRGTPGRLEHKGKARSSHRHSGGKRAR